MTISYRFDALLAESNGTISVFKVYYYLKEDIKSKHELTNQNYKRVLILAKFLYVTCFRIWFPLVFSFISLFYL